MPRNRDIGVTGEPTHYDWGSLWSTLEQEGTHGNVPRHTNNNKGKKRRA